MGSMAAFVDELLKISGVADRALQAGKDAVVPFAKRHGKTMALLGTGATGYHLGKKELDKYLLGRQVYDQMQARQG